MPTLTLDDYLAAIESDSAALAQAVRAAGPDAPVPTCPDWTAADLLDHVGGVHHRVAEAVRTRAQGYVALQDLGPQPPFEEGVAALVSVLRDTPADEPVWNWSLNGPKVAGFWPRRMAQETVVHRWDGQVAADAGAGAAVDPALAVDGIDELLDVFLTTFISRVPDLSLPGTLHVHCTDVEGEWLVGIGGGMADITRAHAKGDCAVRGGASDLLLLLWNRIDPGSEAESGSFEVFGDASVLEAWRHFRI
ncbi:MAG: hypothetical protein QOI20_2862 [Acidimicrobiaceae bacterium]|nr:hypothetical protein [Acidimicrobiaceae bacterium]